MKRVVYLFGVMMLILMTSCNFFSKPDLNQQPAKLSDLLEKAEVTLARALQSYDVAITTALWTQQVQGVSGDALSRYNYVYQSKDVNNLWSDLYVGVMKNCDSIIKLSDERQAYYYKGVAKILYALALGNTTDLFGDVPYSQAFKVKYPSYDPQEQVYKGIFQMLDEGIQILEAGDPGKEELKGDVIYNWDVQKWIKAAYTLKARYIMHLIKVKNIDYNEVISYLNRGLQSLDDDMKLVFYQQNLLPPIYEYLHKHTGLGNNVKFQNLLVQYSDPRITALGYDGFWARQDAYFPFVQYTESEFLKSEVYWRLGDSLLAKEELKKGVQASMQKYFINDQTWYDDYCNYVDSLSYDTLLYEIAVQKYIDELYHPEVFADWRRLGYPHLDAVAGNNVARRFPYSQIEMDRNENAPEQVSVFTPVWWDVQDTVKSINKFKIF